MGVPLGCEARECPGGGRYVRIHYSADPGKRDPGWAESERVGMGRREWDREMEMREDVYDGEPVYADYIDDVHCPTAIRSASLPVVNGSTYFGGWDCGQTLSPAFVLCQVTPRPFQVHALLEVVSEGAMPMETFAPLVLQRLMQWHQGLWADVRHFGDLTVSVRSGSTGETAAEVALRHGVRISPVSNQWAGRYSAVTWMLTRRLAEDMPGLFVSGGGCPVLREGFLGAYRFTPAAAGDLRGPGLILQQPLKNAWSHVHDALQYAALAIKKDLDKRAGGEVLRRGSVKR